MAWQRPPLRRIANLAEHLRLNYRENAAKVWKARDNQDRAALIVWEENCCKCDTELQIRLATLVKKHLSNLFPRLKAVGARRWHDDPDFDWDAADVEFGR